MRKRGGGNREQRLKRGRKRESTGPSQLKVSRDGALIPTLPRLPGSHLGETFPAQPNVKKPTLFLHNGQPKNASQGSSRRADPIKRGREASAACMELRRNAIVKGRVLSRLSNTLRAAKVGVPVVPRAPMRVEELAQCQ